MNFHRQSAGPFFMAALRKRYKTFMDVSKSLYKAEFS